VNHHGGAERGRAAADLRKVQIASNLGQVDARRCRGVEIDAVRAPGHDLGHELVRQPSGQGATRTSRKRTVQVPPIGQVARLDHEPEYVDHGNRDHEPGQARRDDPLEHPADDLHPVQLVAVQRSAEPDARPLPLTVNHGHRKVQHRVRRQARDGDLDSAHASRRDVLTPDRHAAGQFNLDLGRESCPAPRFSPGTR
jgi:hypothetical protein